MARRSIASAAALALGAATLLTIGSTQAQAASEQQIRQADFLAAYSDTRSAGHWEFMAEGLHVWTDDATSQAKAAEYFALNGGLDDMVGSSYVWYGTDNQPGQQIVFWASGAPAGGQPSILVGEAIYGGDWWLTPASEAAAQAVCPETSGGSGSACHGTLAQWAAALPNAAVLAGGFSLGSGLKGDGVLVSQTYGTTTYVFTDEAAVVPPATANVTGTGKIKVKKAKAKIVLKTGAQPANTVLGKQMTWKVLVDGHKEYTATQGFGCKDKIVRKFEKNSGTHKVKVKKNGTVVAKVKVKT